MEIPTHLKGKDKQFLSFGKTYQFLVDFSDEVAVSEFKRQFLFYKSKMKSLAVNVVPKLPFLYNVMLNTTASLIYHRKNHKFFDFNSSTITTVFPDETTLKTIVNRRKKFSKQFPNPKIMSSKGYLVEQFLTFDNISVKDFLLDLNQPITILNNVQKKRKTTNTQTYIDSLDSMSQQLITSTLSKLRIKLPETLTTTLSHGDFHPGNLGRIQEKYYVLDFENIGYALE